MHCEVGARPTHHMFSSHKQNSCFHHHKHKPMENANITPQCLQTKLKKCLNIVRCYDWLIDSYVLDFYLDNHWEKLPLSWRLFFDKLPPEQLCFLLHTKQDVNTTNYVWPLSLLALRQVFRQLSIERRQKCEQNPPLSPLLQHPKLKHVFIKSVKPKKRHELECMASLCHQICQKTPVEFVVDFGAGLGHLARVLGYAYNIKVCCMEMQSQLNRQAYEMDNKMDFLVRKYLNLEDTDSHQNPEHVDLCLTTETTAEEFLETLERALNLPNKSYTFGIIGLHPCGDLGAILMRMFLKCQQAKFINFVGCCYMKLTTPDDVSTCQDYGYPLSNYLRENLALSKLSYEAREISCHAMELYHERLSLKDYEYLKVHSFRAAAERIIVKHYPYLKHTGLKSVKHSLDMEFTDYFYKAVKGLPCEQLPVSDLCTTTTLSDLQNWKHIVIFYTLRLFFAPLVETILLYDRMLFLMENDCQVQINAIFDPRLSPRNHVTSAVKKM